MATRPRSSGSSRCSCRAWTATRPTCARPSRPARCCAATSPTLTASWYSVVENGHVSQPVEVSPNGRADITLQVGSDDLVDLVEGRISFLSAFTSRQGQGGRQHRRPAAAAQPAVAVTCWALIPIHDDNPTRRPAIVNWTIIAINVVVFFISPISPLDVGGDANTPQVLPPTRLLPGVGSHPEGAAGERPARRDRPGRPRETGAWPSGPTTRRSRPSRCSRPCSCTAGCCTWRATCCSCSCSATTSRTGSATPRYLLFYLACGYIATYGFALSRFGEPQWGPRGRSPGCSAPTLSCSRGAGDQPGAVPVLHPGVAAGLDRARLLVLLQWLYFQGAATARAPVSPTWPTWSGSPPAWS